MRIELRRFCGLDGLGEQDGDGGRPYAAGNGGDEACTLGGCGVFNVADVAGVIASVNDNGTGLNPTALDEFGPADGGDDDVGFAHHAGQIDSFGVAVRHGGVAGQEQHPDRFAQYGAAPDYDGTLSSGVDVVGVEQAQDAARRAGPEPFFT